MKHIHPEYFKKRLELLADTDPSLAVNWDQVVIGMELFLDYRMPVNGGEEVKGTVRVPYLLKRISESNGVVSAKEFRKSQVLLEGIPLTVWVEL